MIENLLKEKKCFKLVCGAGNEDVSEIEKLVTIYSLAGANFFDVCAKIDVINAAKKGIKNAGIENERHICVSVGIEGDPHITKANILEQNCKKCDICQNLCPREAIKNHKVNESRCIGCSICAKNCPQNAIKMTTKIQNYNEILPQIVSNGVDCIEFHAISKNQNDVLEKWAQINSSFDGLVCISVDRSTSGDKDLVELVKKMVQQKKPYTTLIQADGVAMSGNDDEYSTTLQAVATAQMFQNSNIPAYIMISGGTNTKTIELAKLCNVKPHAIAVGSYARKIVKEYLAIENLLQDEKKLNEAVEIAKNLVKTSLDNMKND